MSRSGYSDDLDILDLGRWRGQVASATRGQRGQKFFKEALSALDAMPVKELIAYELEEHGQHCLLGAVGAAKGISVQDIEPDDHDALSREFDVAEQLVQEAIYMNDEGGFCETPAQRWVRMRQWVASQIKG